MTDRCWSKREGHGPPVVVVHGAMDRSSSFGRVRRLLTGHQIVSYDRRGYGRSFELGPATSLAQQVDDLAEVLGSVDTPVIAFGHSYGGTIALTLAARQPGRLAVVVAYESPMPWLDWWPTDSAGAAAMAGADDPADGGERFMRRMIGDARWERLPPSTKAARRAEGASLQADLAQLRPPFDDGPPFLASEITVPVIAAHGTEGRPHHRRAATELANAAPNGELAVIDGAGHGVHLSHPTAVVGLIERAVERSGAARS